MRGDVPLLQGKQQESPRPMETPLLRDQRQMHELRGFCECFAVLVLACSDTGPVHTSDTMCWWHQTHPKLLGA